MNGPAQSVARAAARTNRTCVHSRFAIGGAPLDLIVWVATPRSVHS